MENKTKSGVSLGRLSTRCPQNRGRCPQLNGKAANQSFARHGRPLSHEFCGEADRPLLADFSLSFEPDPQWDWASKHAPYSEVASFDVSEGNHNASS